MEQSNKISANHRGKTEGNAFNEEPVEMPWASKYKKDIKLKFEQRYKALLRSDEEYNKFLKYSFSFQKDSFRINRIKVKSDEGIRKIINNLKRFFKLKQIPWFKYGYFYEGERRDIGNTLEHMLGYIYVQEAASMLPAIILNPNKNDRVLDIAAAPGSKTTLISQLMDNEGIIVANDPDFQRVKALSMNIQRMGSTNIVITNRDGLKINDSFSKILVDAPCSGTGTIRKSLKTIQMWNPNMIKRLSKLQKKLIEHAFNMLDEGGVLVYSTCTLEPEEDEGVVNFLINKYENAELENLRNLNLNIKSSEPIVGFEGKEFDSRVRKCLRIWPQDNNTDGFFVARIKKSSQ